VSNTGQSRFGSARAWWSRRGKFSKVAIIIGALIVIGAIMSSGDDTNVAETTTTSRPPSTTTAPLGFTGSAKYEDPAADAVDGELGTAAPDLKVGSDLISAQLSSDGQALTMVFTHANPIPEQPLLGVRKGDLRIMDWTVAMDSATGYTLVTITLSDKWEVKVSATTLGESADKTLDVVPRVNGQTLSVAIPLNELRWLGSPFTWNVLTIWNLRGPGDATSATTYMDVLPGEGLENEPDSPDSWVDFPQSGTTGQLDMTPSNSDLGQPSTKVEYFDAHNAIDRAMVDAIGKVDGWWASEGVSDQDFLDALTSIEDQYEVARALTPPPGFEEVHRYLLSSLAHYSTSVALMRQAIKQKDGEIMQQSKAEWDAGSADIETSTQLAHELMASQ